MRVWGLWHGGSSYAVPTDKDIEYFASMEDARNALLYRENGGDPYHPTVEDSALWLFRKKPKRATDMYPDMVMTLGPRGGVKVELQ